MTLMEFQDALSNNMTLSMFVSLMLCASEYIHVKDKKEFTFTDIDAADWIDDIGGIGGKGVTDMMKVIVDTFTDKGSNGQEKKIPAKAKT